MSADQMPAPPPVVRESLDDVLNALLIAIKRSAEDGAGAQDQRETKECAQAAQAYAQAYVILDPTRLQGGDTPEARVSATPPQVPATRDGDRDGQVGEQ